MSLSSLRRSFLKKREPDSLIRRFAVLEPESLEPTTRWPHTEKFDSQPAIVWLSPLELIRGGLNEVVSRQFGNRTDRRELLPVLDRRASRGFNYAYVHDFSGGSTAEFWLDYVADIGDGFSATYAIAELLAQPVLTFGSTGAVDTVRVPAEIDPHSLDSKLLKGRVLVMGGDEVYAAPVQRVNRDSYWERSVGPYWLASKALSPPDPVTRSVFAIPGNHDWYDGLVAFVKLFTSGRKFGDWETRQRRSYFALKLPRDWWVWGIDTAFEGPIDEPQIEYFQRVSKKLDAHSAIILCTAKPSWLGAKADDAGDKYEIIRHFVDRTLEGKGDRIPIMLTGDHHYYARHSSPEAKIPNASPKRTKIIAGGGGASLSLTQAVPERLEVKEGSSDKIQSYHRDLTWPAIEDAGRISKLCFWRVPATLSFGAMLTVIYALLANFVRWSPGPPHQGIAEFVKGYEAHGWDYVFGCLAGEAWQSLTFVVAALAVLGLLVVLAKSDKATGWTLAALAATHTFAHLVGVLFVTATATWAAFSSSRATLWVVIAGAFVTLLVPSLLGAAQYGGRNNVKAVAVASGLALLGTIILLAVGSDDDTRVYAFMVNVVILGYLVSTLVFASYLYMAQKVRVNTRELAAALRHEGWKNFLRLKVDAEGVTIYALGVERVPRRWVEWRNKSSRGRESWEPTIRGERGQCELIDHLVVEHPNPRPEPKLSRPAPESDQTAEDVDGQQRRASVTASAGRASAGEKRGRVSTGKALKTAVKKTTVKKTVKKKVTTAKKARAKRGRTTND